MTIPHDASDASIDTAIDASVDANSGPVLDQQVLFEARADGYPVFRIPALLETPRGSLLAFAEGRASLQDDGNIDIVVRRSTDNGRTWSPLNVVVDMGPDTAGNPAPLVDRDTGRIWLPFCTNPGAVDTDRRVWLTYSDDDGVTWAPPREITADVEPAGWTWYATGPGRSIQLASVRFVKPCNHADAAGVRQAHVIYSDDHGATWHRGGSSSTNTDESQVVELSNGTLLLGSRFEGPVFARAFSRSSDQGLTWSDATFDNNLPDPHCQGSLIRTMLGLWMSNPATTVMYPRDHLTIRQSLDDGATWAASRLLDGHPSAYSSLAGLPDGRMAILWESGAVIPYDRIRFAAFDPAWVAWGSP